MAWFCSDNLRFNYATRGSGPKTFFFQHGIGGTLVQPLRFLQRIDEQGSGVDKPGACLIQQLRLAAFDFRAHGRTRPGDRQKLRLDIFADDLIAFMDHLQVKSAVLGGISMGAAVALNAVVRYPERCVALVLVRPAWLNGSMCATAVAAYREVVKYLAEEVSPEIALQKLERSDIYRAVVQQSADAGKSLLGQVRCVVSDPSLREAALARLSHLPGGQPSIDLPKLAALSVPTLVLATPNDPIHPLSYAQSLAATIPAALYVELAPKRLDDAPHIHEVNTQLVSFLERMRVLERLV
jgi:pimeloyl-ACP methyl ester carboxylesterase